jgi:hypothetical protein
MNGELFMEMKITDHAFEFGTQKYFRGNSHNCALASYGRKKDRIGAKAYLDVVSKVKVEHVEDRARYNTAVSVNWKNVTRAAFEAEKALKFFGLDSTLGLNADYEKAKDGNFQLVNFVISESALKRMLNQDAGGALKFLADEGSDGRIVSEVWTLMDYELGEHFSTSASVSLSADDGSLEATAKGGKHGTKTIRIADDTTFAYKLHKVKDWNKGKTQVEKLEADWKGDG